MPWVHVNQIKDDNARALYKYLQSLGQKGEQAPPALPPDVELTTTYLSLFPHNMPEMPDAPAAAME